MEKRDNWPTIAIVDGKAKESPLGETRSRYSNELIEGGQVFHNQHSLSVFSGGHYRQSSLKVQDDGSILLETTDSMPSGCGYQDYDKRGCLFLFPVGQEYEKKPGWNKMDGPVQVNEKLQAVFTISAD